MPTSRSGRRGQAIRKADRARPHPRAPAQGLDQRSAAALQPSSAPFSDSLHPRNVPYAQDAANGWNIPCNRPARLSEARSRRPPGSADGRHRAPAGRRGGHERPASVGGNQHVPALHDRRVPAAFGLSTARTVPAGAGKSIAARGSAGASLRTPSKTMACSALMPGRCGWPCAQRLA